MAEQDSTTETTPKEKPKWSAGPKAVGIVKDQLGVIIAFSYLGKRAYMEGDYSAEGWKEYLSKIGSPFGEFELNGIAEMAFEGLLKMACEAWHELNDPADAVEGKHIDRTRPAPEGGAS